MKRFKILGLCMFAVFAFSAMLAASAQAGKETSGPIDIESEGGAAHLGTELGVELESTNNAGRGTFENGTVGRAITNFYHVKVHGGGACTSAGEETGTVKTQPLSEELGWINSGAKSVGAAFKAAVGENNAVFHCETLGEVKVKGSVVATITSPEVNVASKEGSLALKGFGGFKQEPEKLEGKGTDTLESHFESLEPPGVFTPSAQFQSDVTKNHGNGTVCKRKEKPGKPTIEKCKPAATEIWSLGTGQPQIGRCVKQSGGKWLDASCSTVPTKKGKYEFKPAEPGSNAVGYGPGED